MAGMQGRQAGRAIKQAGMLAGWQASRRSGGSSGMQAGWQSGV
jgi:hypothetical protein